MKKLTTIILWAIGLAGTYLVGEGIITGEELGAIQNVIGMALGGGAVSVGLVIAIISAIPKQLVTAAYDKAVDKYGVDQVDNILANFDEFRTVLADTNLAVNEVKLLLEEAKEARIELLNE